MARRKELEKVKEKKGGRGDTFISRQRNVMVRNGLLVRGMGHQSESNRLTVLKVSDFQMSKVQG